MQQYCKALRLPETQWVEFAATFLRDGASTWWRAHLDLVERQESPLITEWNVFKRVLTTQFQPVNAQKIARDRLHNLRQTKSVVEFVYEFHKICLEIKDVSPSEKLDRFVRGLKPSVREKVDIEDPQTVDEAMQIAQRIDSIQWTNRNRQREHGQRNRYHTAYRSSSVKREFNAAVIQPNHGQGKAEARLHAIGNNYGRKVNFRRPFISSSSSNSMSFEQRQRCLQEKLCFKCRRPGHMIKECPLNKGTFNRKSSKSFNHRSGKDQAR